MVLHTLSLRSFRAHSETRLSFSPKVNLIYGPNGAGKTNLLEAVHYLCLTKSFIATSDAYALRHEDPFFELEGHFSGDHRPSLDVRLAYAPGEGKRVFVNGAPLDRLSEIVGRFPVVEFSPQDHALTSGGPDERRRFLDNVLSQARPVYLNDLLQYRRALKQRNRLLSEHRRRRTAPPPAVQDPWDAELADLGSRIIFARSRFLREFAAYLERAYRHIADVAERPTATYESAVDLSAEPTQDEIAAAFTERLDRLRRREHQRGLTLAGPHRDELLFELDELEVRRYASQGQHRTFGMALKLAKYFYLQDHLDERPILLLDDVFDHLDAARSAAFLAIVQGDDVGQSLITATSDQPFVEHVAFEQPAHHRVKIVGGQPYPSAGGPDPDHGGAAKAVRH